MKKMNIVLKVLINIVFALAICFLPLLVSIGIQYLFHINLSIIWVVILYIIEFVVAMTLIAEMS